MDIHNNFNQIKHACVLFLIMMFVSGCQPPNNRNAFTIDLTVVYRDKINSYKIDPQGKVLALLNKTYESGKLYKVEFTKQEMDSMQSELYRITAIKCDTLMGDVYDGLRYAISLDNQKQKFNISGNLCAKYEGLDKLVYSIVKKVEKRDKKEFYSTFNRMVPPPYLETDTTKTNN